MEEDHSLETAKLTSILFDEVEDMNRSFFDSEAFFEKHSEFTKEFAKEQARKEMLAYVVNMVNAEFWGVSEDDALLNWQAYKELHNIN